MAADIDSTRHWIGCSWRRVALGRHWLLLALGLIGLGVAIHVEHQTPGAIGGVDGLFKHLKGDGLRFQPGTNGNEVGHASCKPVELCDDKNVECRRPKWRQFAKDWQR